MLTIHRLIVTAAVAITFICAPFTATAQESSGSVRPARNYDVHVLTLGGSNCAVSAISEGTAVGWGSTPGDAAIHAFVWTQKNGIVDIGTLGGSRAEAAAVDGDRVVGFSLTAGDAESHAFSWTPAGGMRDLGTLGGSFSGAVSVSGNRVVGESRTALGDIHAFVWTPQAGMVDLGKLPGGTESSPAQIHRGLTAGWSATNGNAARHPVAWLANGQIIEIASAGGASTGVRDGVVTGYRQATAALEHHAFIWTMSFGEADLGVVPGFNESFAFATDGQFVVGQVSGIDPAPVTRPFVWTESSGMAVIGPASVQGFATHVSAGRVIGLFTTPSINGPRTFLWTATQGMVDVTPRSFTDGARPAGIDAQGRIAVVDEQGDINVFRSAVLIPRGH